MADTIHIFDTQLPDNNLHRRFKREMALPSILLLGGLLMGETAIMAEKIESFTVYPVAQLQFEDITCNIDLTGNKVQIRCNSIRPMSPFSHELINSILLPNGLSCAETLEDGSVTSLECSW